MGRSEIIIKNVGKNLEELSHLDPRGYGVCKILQKAAYEKCGETPVIHAAKEITKVLQPGDPVVLLTGFILSPFNKAETDGIAGTAAIATTLIKAYKVRPIIVCPSEAVSGIKAELQVMLKSKAPEIIAFPKDKKEAVEKARIIIETVNPKVCISVEAPGENSAGVYHNAIGEDVTAIEAKLDTVFDEAKLKKILTVSIGDLGNEIGMGTLKEEISKYVPYTAEKGFNTVTCKCGCQKGTMARTEADIVVTATVSDWGGYALANALAFFKKMPEAAPSGEMIAEALKEGAKHRLIDMFGEEIPEVDGCSLEMNVMIGSLMNRLIAKTIKEGHKYEHWFNSVEKMGYFRE